MTAGVSTFSHKLRTRICGLLVEDNAVLLVQIHSPVSDSLVWMPPGGGLQHGEKITDCLEREFLEETNLKINVRDLIHINELVSLPYHALEYYFEVSRISGEPKLGYDPEVKENPLLHDIRWVPLNELPSRGFAPESLLETLLDWEHRFQYPVFPDSRS